MRKMLLAVVAMAAVLVGGAPPPASGSRAVPVDRDLFIGQWVWTVADANLHREAAAKRDIGAAVFVATLSAEGDEVRYRRALSPTSVDSEAIVIRMGDSLHALWDRHGTAGMGDQLARRIQQVLAEVRPTGAAIREVQLDYDAPVRRLPAWATVVNRLAQRELADLDVWITSIPAHVRAKNYGALFRGAIAGHILQLFDTGLPCDRKHATALSQQLRAHALPYRIGLGAFERGSKTAHGCWFERWPELASAHFEGLWVFPAGRPYLHLLPREP